MTSLLSSLICYKIVKLWSGKKRVFLTINQGKVREKSGKFDSRFGYEPCESRTFGLEINKRKIFCMTISKKNVSPKCKLEIDGIEIKLVDKFEYLGSLIASDAKSDQEIKRRIGIAKTAFKCMSNVLTAKNIKSQTKLRLIKCYIWSTMLYGCETRTISEAMKKQPEAAEMWFLRRMMKISWIKKVTNEDVLRRALTERQLMKQIVKRQCSFLGHILRKDASNVKW